MGRGMGSCPHRQGEVGGSRVVSSPGGQGSWKWPWGSRRSGSVGGDLIFLDELEDTMKKGMNPEAVEQMGSTAETAGDEVNTVYTTVQGRVTDFDWTGEDRDKYVSEFEGTLGGLVQQVVSQAQQFAERARQNAQQQREASS